MLQNLDLRATAVYLPPEAPGVCTLQPELFHPLLSSHMYVTRAMLDLFPQTAYDVTQVPLFRSCKSKAWFDCCQGNHSITLPFFIESSNHLCATGVVSPTHGTLVVLQLRADDAVTASAHTLAPDADGVTVGPALSPIRHLNDKDPMSSGKMPVHRYLVSMVKQQVLICGGLRLTGIVHRKITDQPKTRVPRSTFFFFLRFF